MKMSHTMPDKGWKYARLWRIAGSHAGLHGVIAFKGKRWTEPQYVDDGMRGSAWTFRDHFSERSAGGRYVPQLLEIRPTVM